MSVDSMPTDREPGYLSAEAKRQFTLITGVLGAVFFVIQMILPIVVMFAVMFPSMAAQGFHRSDFDHAVLWKGELWFVEVEQPGAFGGKGARERRTWLKHASVADLQVAPDAVQIDPPEGPADANAPFPELLPQGERLWVLDPGHAATFADGKLTRLGVAIRPPRASRAFLYRGEPAVITLGRRPALVVLTTAATGVDWRNEELALEPPIGADSFRRAEVVEVGGNLHIVAEACAEVDTRDSEVCSFYTRELFGTTWSDLQNNLGCCTAWTALPWEGTPAVLAARPTDAKGLRLALLLPDAERGEQRNLPTLAGTSTWDGGAALDGAKLLLFADTQNGGRRLYELEGMRQVRTAHTAGKFPLESGMLALMFVPQLVPMVLSLVLAFILSAQMRKHRTETYEWNGRTRRYATLWQRAWAQVIDAVIIAGPAVLGFGWFFRAVTTDPDGFAEQMAAGSLLWLIGSLAFAFCWMLGTLVLFSVFEGRSGRTPGKALLGIRVIGAELAPCGFWRALVRNLLTFVDGFFNFLVGVLLVALTDHWQRLGDLAARTVVVTDEPEKMQTRVDPI